MSSEHKVEAKAPQPRKPKVGFEKPNLKPSTPKMKKRYGQLELDAEILQFEQEQLQAEQVTQQIVATETKS